MRVPRVRFTVRTLMVLVAVVAIILGGMILRQRAASYRQRAAQFGWVATGLRQSAASGNAAFLHPTPTGPGTPMTQAMSLRWAEYYAGLRAKYEHAALYPWLPVEPDPPEPE